MEFPFGTEVTGEILHGRSFTEIVEEQEEAQPNLKILSVSVKVPTKDAVTLMVVPMVEPMMIPFPEIDQE